LFLEATPNICTARSRANSNVVATSWRSRLQGSWGCFAGGQLPITLPNRRFAANVSFRKHEAPFTAAQVTKRLAQARSLRRLQRLLDEHRSQFDRVHWITLLHRAAVLTSDKASPQRLPSWLQGALGNLEAAVVDATSKPSSPLTAREAASALWAITRLRLCKHARLAGGKPSQLPRLLGEAMRRQLRVAGTQELSNFVWATANLRLMKVAGSRPNEFAAELASACGARVSDMETQHWANISWAFGTLRTAHHSCLVLFRMCLCSVVHLKASLLDIW